MNPGPRPKNIRPERIKKVVQWRIRKRQWPDRKIAEWVQSMGGNVSIQTVGRLRRNLNIEAVKPPPLINDEIRARVVELSEQGKTNLEIARTVSVSKDAITKILGAQKSGEWDQGTKRLKENFKGKPLKEICADIESIDTRIQKVQGKLRGLPEDQPKPPKVLQELGALFQRKEALLELLPQHLREQYM